LVKTKLDLKGIKLDREFEDFLKLKSRRTAETYKGAYRHFLFFYKSKHGEDVNIGHFLDRIFNNLKKPREEQQPRLIESELVEFVNYLKENKLSNNTIRVYIAAMQNFLKYYNITVSMSFIGNMPQPIVKKRNHKHEYSIDDIREFVNSAPTYRDKAIILCLFQSGLGINELIGLDYGDIQDELEKGIIPIHLRLRRKKTGVEFRTFFGRDAVKYLKLYLATRKNLTPESPLFTRWNSDTERATTGAIEMKFREIAKKLSFIKERDLKGYNPCRPHSLRAAFASRLTGKIDRVLIEFWMGHQIGEEKRAYLNMPTEEMRELYRDAEKYLAIERTSRDEIIESRSKEAKIPPETLAEIEELKATIKGLTRQYNEMERKLNHFMKVADLSPEKFKALSEIVGRWMEKERLREEQEAYEREQKENEEILAKLRKEGKL